MTGYLQVTTTTDNRETAVHLAESVVRAKLAATAQVRGPVDSYFWHLEEFGSGQEWVITFKTTVDCYPRLETHIVDRHPWESPEVSAVPISDGRAAYLEWLDRSVDAGP
ncbi:MAG: divalent-cation tolerance protein CutA [Actinomycetota bacterium]|nr:divalent-cation tolerance protein CutA [Actinomycetota bacterium]